MKMSKLNSMRQMLILTDNTTIICRLIDGKYPNYDAVIPKDNPNKLTIETSVLLSSIKEFLSRK